MAAIAFDDVDLGYGREIVVPSANLRIDTGSAIAIIGPNGAGKSTLLKTIAGLLKPVRGKVGFEGCARTDVAYLPQRADVERSFPVSTHDLVTLGGWRKLGGFAPADTALASAVDAALERVGLAGMALRPIGELSIGQFQRALFARLIVQDRPIILLDEPFAAIDTGTTSHLLHLVGEWQAQGRTIIAALHDMNQVRGYFTRAVLLDRAILGIGSVDEISGMAERQFFHAAADCGH
jgi:zinc/manganese transport system ATP-binding protein